MGLEVGWHLRFSRLPVVEALIAPNHLEQVRGQLFILPEWGMETIDRGDHLLVRFARRREG